MNTRNRHRGPLERFLPDPVTTTRQSVIVDAAPDGVFDAVLDTDLVRSPVVRWLSSARALPDRVVRALRRRPGLPEVERPTIEGLIEAGYWDVLERRPGESLALGLVMWDERSDDATPDRARIFAEPSPGAVRVGWSFELEPLPAGGTLLTTETRTEPADELAQRRFTRYWRAISPFASLVRRSVLDEIAAEAEHRARHRADLERADHPVPAG